MNSKRINFLITNLFTLCRAISVVALIPVFKIYGGFATFLLCSCSFLTDFIDGRLARELKSSTFFGSLFDALTDKAFLVVNLLLLMSISPLAIIPVLFELGIAYIQSVKYNKGMNIQTNKFGKAKMWVAGIVISLSYLLVDKTSMDLMEIKLFALLFIPLIISETLTLISYVKEYLKENKKLTSDVIKSNEKKDEKLKKEINNISFKQIMFEHEYFEKYKDYGNLKLVKALSMKNKGRLK